MVNNTRGDIHTDNLWITIVIWGLVALINLVAILINENNPLTKRCCKFTKFLGITNRASFVSRSSRPRQFFAWDLLDARHLVTGWLHPVLLLAYRLLAVAYFLFVMIFKAVGPRDLANGFGRTGTWITFFTNWTFVGFALYALLGVIVSYKEVKSRSQRWHTESESQPFGFWDKAYLLVLNTMLTSGITLTVFYWLAIYDGGKVFVDNPLVHGGNVAIMLLDVFLTRTPIVTYHFVAPVLYGTTYMVFMWVLYAISGFWRYAALNGTRFSSIFNYLILFALLLISYLIVYLFVGVREWIHTGRCCCLCCSSCGECCQEDEVQAHKSVEFDAVVVHNNPMLHDGLSMPNINRAAAGQFMAR